MKLILGRVPKKTIFNHTHVLIRPEISWFFIMFRHFPIMFHHFPIMFHHFPIIFHHFPSCSNIFPTFSHHFPIMSHKEQNRNCPKRTSQEPFSARNSSRTSRGKWLHWPTTASLAATIVGKFHHDLTSFSRTLEMMVRIREIIPFYGNYSG